MEIDVIREAWRTDWNLPEEWYSSPIASCVLTPEGRILEGNEFFKRFVDGADGSSFDAVTVNSDVFQSAMKRALREGHAGDCELALRVGEGVRWAIACWKRRRASQGVVIELSLVDISRLKQAEAERDALHHENKRLNGQLQTAREALVQTEAMASLGSLVASVTHEVSTPLGIGVTAASHLADQVERLRDVFENGRLRKAEMSEFLTSAVEATRLLVANLIRADELIQSFKKVAVDRTSGAKRVFDLKTFIDEVLFTLRPRLRRGGVAVDVACPEDLRLDSYPGALSQVITNLIVNALVHAYGASASGRSIGLTAQAGVDGMITLSIADQGAGIAPENLAHIFEPYFTTRREQGGSGLGLHIVHTTVTRLLGGTVNVESTPGVGTRFTIILPATSP